MNQLSNQILKAGDEGIWYPEFADGIIPGAANSNSLATILQNFSQLGMAEMVSRKQDVQRFLKENGVTYNIYQNTGKLNRGWELDPIPLLLEEKHWNLIEKGLEQRAQLLQAVLADLYGPQRLLKEGVLPSELVFRHKGFIRHCVGMLPASATNLMFYSANMAISKDGTPWVISDRVQAPSGAGYALENRMAVTRMIPELFKGVKVSRLSPYFEQIDHSLQLASPGKPGQARIVILTPGPNNETYFEHSYLASYLGYTLVEGSDLMVRDRCVWLKTIGGLEKVDVIIRRVDDWYCDPLELKEDSLLGVPGLLQAVRAGNVYLANPLGCGILESPGLMPFLQGISQFFNKEELVIPNIASWWCGQEKEKQYVLDNLPNLVVKKIFRTGQTSSSEDGNAKTPQQLEVLRQQIMAKPWLYVGQEKVDFAPIPVFDHNKIGSRIALFRTFSVNSPQGFVAMDGGLTITSGVQDSFLISNQLGGFSKDTWVLKEGASQKINLAQTKPAQMQQAKMLPSKTAESLFWVGRYGERLLGCARMMRTVMHFVTDGERLLDDTNMFATEVNLLKILTHYTCTYPGFVEEKATKKFTNPWPELTSMMMDAKKPGSIHFNLLEFLRVVYNVRDYWTTDNWRILKSIEDLWEDLCAVNKPSKNRLIQALDGIITGMVAFVGLNRESISRDQGWGMLDLGRKLEQSLLLTSLLRSSFTIAHNEQVLYYIMESVLKSQEALVNYRFKHRTHLQLPLVLDLMMLDHTHPRSLAFQAERMLNWIRLLPHKQSGHQLSPLERSALETYNMVQLAQLSELLKVNPKTATLPALEKMLAKVYGLLAGMPAALSKDYFLHSQQQKQLFDAHNAEV